MSSDEYPHIYDDYEYIARGYPGFSLSELRGLSPRERRYWVSLTTWQFEKK